MENKEEILVRALLDMFDRQTLMISFIVKWYSNPVNREIIEKFNNKFPRMAVEPPIIEKMLNDKNLISEWIFLISGIEQANAVAKELKDISQLMSSICFN